jgi:hypothetical protein
MTRTFDVTVSVEVTDEEMLIYAATVWLVKHGGVPTMAQARALLKGDDAVGQALRLLIDPGAEIGGMSVQDSTVVEII